jgi:uncharacterized protein YdaU (DUF1376 family)
MNYYPHHIGDFRSGTFNMTRLERWIYRDMLEIYYDTEAPLPVNVDALCKGMGVRTPEEKAIVADILSYKFELTGAGYIHARCDQEIVSYHAKAETARENGKKGGRKPKSNPAKPSGAPKETSQDDLANPAEPTGLDDGTKPVGAGLENGTQPNPIATGSQANQEPVTNNHKPKKSKAESAPATRLPADWVPSDGDAEFCKSERPDLRVNEVADRFRDYWRAMPGVKGQKTDWNATWRNWVRSERRGTAQGPPPSAVKFDPVAYVNRNRINP